MGASVSLELPGPLSNVLEIALRAAQEHGVVLNVLRLHVPVQFRREVELGVAEGTVDRGLGL